jgi:leucyl aminopeptidase
MLSYSPQKIFTDLYSLTLKEAKLSAESAFKNEQLLIVGIPQDEKNLKSLIKENDFLKSAFEKAQNIFGFKGKFGENSLITEASAILFIGLGEDKDYTPKKLLNLGGKILQLSRKVKKNQIVFAGDTFLSPLKTLTKAKLARDFAERSIYDRPLTKEEALDRVLCGFFMASYKGKKSLQKAESKKEIQHIHVLCKQISKSNLTQLQKDVTLKAEAISWIRDETHCPPNVLYPESFAKEISELGNEAGFKTKIFDEVRLQKEGFGGIWSVGKGSINPPRLVQMEYNASKSNVPHLVLVGKGVTFDTGGISLKPAPQMEEMKHDMTGAAITVATMAYLAKSKSPLKVTALVPLAENRPSHNSILPGEVYKAWGGKTVEVQNTDAEGRLILGDCLAYASGLKPDLVIDMATLTGAAIITLGSAAFLLYGNKGTVTESFVKATHQAGEQCWEMPLFSEYYEDLKSSVADMRNITGHRDGGSHTAAAFLEKFVEGAYPWLHLDICSYSMFTKWKGAHCPPEANCGLPFLALAEFAKNFSVRKAKSNKK